MRSFEHYEEALMQWIGSAIEAQTKLKGRVLIRRPRGFIANLKEN